jgi:large conductance mechanosensitive channel
VSLAVVYGFVGVNTQSQPKRGQYFFKSAITFLFRDFLLSKEDEMLIELRKIREALEKAPPPQPPKGLWNEFKDFLAKYRIFGLAIAFIVGLYLGTLVQALVKDLLLPAIGLAIPGMSNLATLTVGPFGIGDFLVALITFLIVALLLFLAVKVAKRWKID